ncbi:hypothetical protein [Desulfolithobacter dissulfuricans]|uniref:hypothetical protein n=1 Tax=Desulfolithobacter dissulfuricans TaxID=2795293 RepID=UPI00227921C9|nr:hypothetical protein [Desulfolithobacter dissulfuricans]
MRRNIHLVAEKPVLSDLTEMRAIENWRIVMASSNFFIKITSVGHVWFQYFPTAGSKMSCLMLKSCQIAVLLTRKSVFRTI